MQEITKEPRIVQLRSLLTILASEIDRRPGARDLAQLAKQYRETLAEIEQIEGKVDQDDDIAEILNRRQSDGKSGAVR